MANLKEIAAALAILTAGTLTLSGCKKEETATPDDAKAADTAAVEEAPAEGGEASCSGDKAAEGGEASCSGEAAADGAAEG
jgi:hypothetical protein